VEGPVFRGDLVRWEDVGTIPFDALGAPGWKPRPVAGSAGHGAADSGAGQGGGAQGGITEGRSHAG
jgi:dihydroorotate dehydrogenase electron transfer subunit